MTLSNKARVFIASCVFMPLGACMMPMEGAHSEQQERMMRCDQYIGDQREDCLRGEAVTIDDYKDDLKNYNKSKKQEAIEEEGPVIKKSTEKPVNEQINSL